MLLSTFIVLYTNKRYLKLMAHTFSRVSVGLQFVIIGQADETGQRLKEIEFDKPSLCTLLSTQPQRLNRLPRFCW